jgi:predicted naringenin-chalcone synthase
MPYILDIATASPAFRAEAHQLNGFYAKALAQEGENNLEKKIAFLNRKTKINTRNYCIPDITTETKELFIDSNYKPSIENRMALYKEKVTPLAVSAIDKVLKKSGFEKENITHLITVSCTGLTTPGIEFYIAKALSLEHTEKLSINFLGCYASFKAIKAANNICLADPNATVLVISVELCSLHFYPSAVGEDIIANLLFADGAAAALICGDKVSSPNKQVLAIAKTGSAFIPDTEHLMTWDISSSAFRMYLSGDVVKSIKNDIENALKIFLKTDEITFDLWAVHPGGIKIVEAVQAALNLPLEKVQTSIDILRDFGNMSSATILFILEKLMTEIRTQKEDKSLLSVGFGPGLNVEMITYKSILR